MRSVFRSIKAEVTIYGNNYKVQRSIVNMSPVSSSDLFCMSSTQSSAYPIPCLHVSGMSDVDKLHSK